MGLGWSCVYCRSGSRTRTQIKTSGFQNFWFLPTQAPGSVQRQSKLIAELKTELGWNSTKRNYFRRKYGCGGKGVQLKEPLAPQNWRNNWRNTPFVLGSTEIKYSSPTQLKLCKYLSQMGHNFSLFFSSTASQPCRRACMHPSILSYQLSCVRLF